MSLKSIKINIKSISTFKNSIFDADHSVKQSGSQSVSQIQQKWTGLQDYKKILIKKSEDAYCKVQNAINKVNLLLKDIKLLQIKAQDRYTIKKSQNKKPKIFT